jgi:hypothetical protein
MARKIPTLASQITTVIEKNGGVISSESGNVNSIIRKALISDHKRLATRATMSTTLRDMANNGHIIRMTNNTKTYEIRLKSYRAPKQDAITDNRLPETLDTAERALFFLIETASATLRDLVSMYASLYVNEPTTKSDVKA